ELRNMSLLDLLNLDLSDNHKTNQSKIIAEYIWIDGSGMNLRSKARTLHGPVTNPSQLPQWNYDGSSTGQAPGEDSELESSSQQTKRFNAAKIFSHPEVLAEEPWFGIEQEYTLLQKNLNWPLGWPIGGYRGPQGPYYCGVLVGILPAPTTKLVYTLASTLVELMQKLWQARELSCPVQRAGYPIPLALNLQRYLVQWEFQVGPAVGISPCDDLWVARYILVGDCNGAGAHTNYSTKSMRADGGLEVIKKAIEKLGKRHKEHIAAYGAGNERRLTGEHETADINTFNFGIADRGASIRIGRDTEKAGKGYLEDRRPSSNMEPYVVTSMIAETTILLEP
ncbi:hypothetical protein HAX54_006502, partial [Datura stramonium]|nr:hypothetical protein [Datura stramonium]